MQSLAVLVGDETVNHLGAVHMVWDLDRLTGRAGLRETLSVDLQSTNVSTKLRALSALGVLWRLSGPFVRTLLDSEQVD